MKRLRFFGNGAAVHHIGLGVSAIKDAAIPRLRIFKDPRQQVEVAFVDVDGCVIELVQPSVENSPVSNSIGKGHKFLHVCFEVDRLEKALQTSEKSGFKIIQNPTPAVAFNGRRIAWTYHPIWGLFELLERRKSTKA